MKCISTIFALIIVIIYVSNALSQTDWAKHPNSVLTPGPIGDWDQNNVLTSSVILDGSMYYLWYDNYNVANHQFEHIGYATSNDGVSWTKYDDPTTTNPPFTQSDPVLSPGPGSYDNIGVGHPCVRKYNDIYHMWYTGDNNSSATRGMTICHATSPDRIVWTKDPNNPVLDLGPSGAWDERWISTPDVVFDGSIYHMVYSGWDGIYPPNQIRIGHATSIHPDSVWSKDPNNPILDIGTPSCWDYDRVDAPCIIFDGYRFHMFYSGGATFFWRIGYAWSIDGSNWTKYNDPTTSNTWLSMSDFVLDWGITGAFDDGMVSDGTALLDNQSDTVKIWYTGKNVATLRTEFGYAKALFDTSFLTGIDKFSQTIPNSYQLKQNYPNPFNPSTTIEFDLPKSSEVTLKVYNILGEEVATLLSASLLSGSHSVDWDASNLASGVYLYRLQAGGYVETRKMVLMR
jgi:hypothetical protein